MRPLVDLTPVKLTGVKSTVVLFTVVQFTSVGLSLVNLTTVKIVPDCQQKKGVLEEPVAELGGRGHH